MLSPTNLSSSSPSIAVIANAGSGRNSHEAEAIERAMAVFGPRGVLHYWEPVDDISALVHRLIDEGHTTLVAAGGDGTIMAVAGAMMGTATPMAVLPLGTFNYFARGLGLPQDPEAAARAILSGREQRIAIGTVNGQVFLNNASVGLYPSILKEREAIYGRWGRYRLLAHWSVAKTVLRFQHPMRVRLIADGEARDLRTPLIFCARSAYQLERYGLEGAEAISDDHFVMFVMAGQQTRAALFRLAWRLVTRRLRIGKDVVMIIARRIEVHTPSPHPLVAYDGEKRRMTSPLVFEIRDDALTIVLPRGDATEGDA